ncbi:MAG: helix-turn-helix domain-containing protein [Pseudomonadota bacterium]
MSDTEPVAEQTSPGRVLASARAVLKLSVADVSQQIKYGVKQIEAIEAGDYAKLPGTTFVRGMIRSYAKLLQINAEPLLVDLGRRDIPSPVSVDLRTGGQEPFVESGGKSNRVYVLLSAAALVAVAVVAYEWWAHPLDTGEVVTIMPRAAQGEVNPAPPAAAPAPAPAPAPMPALTSATAPVAPASAPAAASATAPAADAATRSPVKPALAAAPAGADKAASGGKNRIELNFDQLSWVEIRQANGKILLSQLNQPGTRQVIEGVPPFEVVIGNAANVRLKYEGEAVDLRPHFKVDVARLTLE